MTLFSFKAFDSIAGLFFFYITFIIETETLLFPIRTTAFLCFLLIALHSLIRNITHNFWFSTVHFVF